jgi:hypothetical protein
MQKESRKTPGDLRLLIFFIKAVLRLTNKIHSGVACQRLFFNVTDDFTPIKKKCFEGRFLSAISVDAI